MNIQLPIECPDLYIINDKNYLNQHIEINNCIAKAKGANYVMWSTVEDEFVQYAATLETRARVNFGIALIQRFYHFEDLPNEETRPVKLSYGLTYEHAIDKVFGQHDDYLEHHYELYFDAVIAGYNNQQRRTFRCLRETETLTKIYNKKLQLNYSKKLIDKVKEYLDTIQTYEEHDVNSFRNFTKRQQLASDVIGINNPIEIIQKEIMPSFGFNQSIIKYFGQVPVFENDPYEAGKQFVDDFFKQSRIPYGNEMRKLPIFQELMEHDRVAQKNAVMALVFKMIFDEIYGDFEYKQVELCNLIMKKKLSFSEEEMIAVLNAIKHDYLSSYFGYLAFYKNVNTYLKTNELSTALKKSLEGILHIKEEYHHTKSFKKLQNNIQELFAQLGGDTAIKPVLLDENDTFGQKVNPQIANLPKDEAKNWYNLFTICKKATSGKPSKKLQKDLSAAIQKVGQQDFIIKMIDWLDFLTAMEVTNDGWTAFIIKPLNQDIVKGLIWGLSEHLDAITMSKLHKFTMKCYKKLPNIGQTAGALGNACVFGFYNRGSLESLSFLSRMKVQVRQNNTKKLINNYILKASKELGISPAMLEDMATQEYELTDGKVLYSFGEYGLEVRIQSIGKVTMQWYKPDGKPQKSVPAYAKNNHAEDLKRIKAQVKNIRQTLTTQRDRLDRSYIENRTWTFSDFKKYYFDHGLMSYLAKRLIWIFEQGDQKATAFWKDGWKTQNGIPVDWIDEDTTIRLWHPVHATIDQIQAWRDYMQKWEVKQPLKQAFREVYLLTDAEVNTRTYSNRMAAHILKQHQFNSLAKLRGWQYSLIGGWDGGWDEKSRISIPNHQLTAEYWINSLPNDEHFNDNGIYLYVGTDQVRFYKNSDLVNPIALIDVPKIVFSEVMRDVDLFVGVASVGNDPEWSDNGGLPQYRDYWTSYSFGDLTEVAKTRKTILERLLPKLKIAKISEIDGKFLKVKGTYTTYKIHIGSTNILMEPNDQYLCIVPSGKNDKKTDGVFLPFEGDRGFSILLSKAFMLAADDKIKDPTIISQLPIK